MATFSDFPLNAFREKTTQDAVINFMLSTVIRQVRKAQGFEYRHDVLDAMEYRFVLGKVDDLSISFGLFDFDTDFVTSVKVPITTYKDKRHYRQDFLMFSTRTQIGDFDIKRTTTVRDDVMQAAEYHAQYMAREYLALAHLFNKKPEEFNGNDRVALQQIFLLVEHHDARVKNHTQLGALASQMVTEFLANCESRVIEKSIPVTAKQIEHKDSKVWL
jgi:hypothetical protein